jgi:hypothetical protein
MVEVCRAGYSVPGFSFVEGVGFRSRDCSVLIVDTGVADALRVSCGDIAEEGCLLVSLLRNCQFEKKTSQRRPQDLHYFDFRGFF